MSGNLGEEVGDDDVQDDEGKEALQGLGLLGVEPATEEKGDINVDRTIVEVGTGADPEHQR